VRAALVLRLLLVGPIALSLPIAAVCGQTLSDGPTPDYSAATLYEVVPGRTTKAEVEALLGKPWRDTNLLKGYADADVWEYRGHAASGGYRVHIEFNRQNVVTLIAKIPDKTGVGVSTRAQSGFDQSPRRAPAKISWPWD